METEGDGADEIFNLGEDDEEDADNPNAGSAATEIEEGEGVMGSDPYNPEDWDDVLPEAEAENETSALLFGDNGQEDVIDVGNSDDDHDLNSLMDRGLEEIDDLLSTKGRLSVYSTDLGQAQSEGDTAKTRNHRPSPLLAGRDGPDNGSLATAEKGATMAEKCSEGELTEGGVGRLALDSTQNPKHTSARGTGANAASALMSTTAPSGSAGAVGDSTFLDPLSTKRDLGGSSSVVVINGDEGGTHSNGQAPHGSEEVTRSYFYEARTLHAYGNADHLASPPRRREKGATPFIQARGLSLTYAQAKLFGLAGSPHPAGGGLKSDLKANVTWPRSGPQPQTISGTRCTGVAASARDGGERHPTQQRNPPRTYSPSRMEQLCIPGPGRGRFGDSCVGGGKSADHQREGNGGRGRNEGGSNPPFTWKRSRKAEAAMRDPACGYDFVREAGYSREDFLARAEAYSSYSRQKIETRRGEDHYAARVDKLECPQCHNPQSYDEFVSKKIKCGGCDVAYCVPRAWNRRIWDQRNEMRMAKSEERKARIEREAEEEYLKRMPKHTRHAALLRQQAGQVGFIRRMRRDLQRRRVRERGARRPQGNEDVEDQYADRQGKDAPGRPATALTTTTGNRTMAMAPRGTTGSPEGKQRSGSRRPGGEPMQGG